MTSPVFPLLSAFVATLAAAAGVQACSVCFGNPESPLTHGAQQGVLTMLLITYGLLIGLVSMFTFVIVKARRRQAQACDHAEPATVTDHQGG